MKQRNAGPAGHPWTAGKTRVVAPPKRACRLNASANARRMLEPSRELLGPRTQLAYTCSGGALTPIFNSNARGETGVSDALREQIVVALFVVRAVVERRARRRSGRDDGPEPRREHVEVVEVHVATVVEVALREGSVRLSEIRGHDVEVVEVDAAVAVGVTSEDVEVDDVVAAQRRPAGVRDARADQSPAEAAVGEDTIAARVREGRDVGRGIVRDRDVAGRDRLAEREVLEDQVIAAQARADVLAEREAQPVRGPLEKEL